MSLRFPTLTRRRLLATSGAAAFAGSPLALGACGTDDEVDESAPERQAELLNAVLAQQLAVVEAARAAASAAPRELAPAASQLRNLRRRSAEALATEVSDLDGEPAGPVDLVGQAESAVEGLGDQLEASIAAALEAIGDLDPERRVPVHRAITEDAAVLAAVRATLGEKPAPDAFVFGPPVAEVRE